MEKSWEHILQLAHNLADFKIRCPHRPLQVSKTIFEYANFSEPQISWVISEILAYYENEEYPILQLFLDEYFPTKNLRTKHPSIQTEHSNIDVCIIDEEYILIIENKVKGAVFQHNQMGRYIHWAETYYPNKIILTAILSKTGNIGYKSTWRYPGKGFTQCNFNNILCECDNLSQGFNKPCCEECVNYEKYKADNIILKDNFVQWVKTASEIVPNREHRLYSMMIQFADYLNTLFGVEIHTKYNMEIQKFIEMNIVKDNKNRMECLGEIYKKIKETESLITELKTLNKTIRKEFIENCYRKMKESYGESACIRNDKDECGITLIYKEKEIWIYISIGENDYQPSWGLWIGNATNDDITDINRILESHNIEQMCVRWEGNTAGLSIQQTSLSNDEVYTKFKELVNAFKLKDIT